MRVGIVSRRLCAIFSYRPEYPDRCDYTIIPNVTSFLVSSFFCLRPDILPGLKSSVVAIKIPVSKTRSGSSSISFRRQVPENKKFESFSAIAGIAVNRPKVVVLSRRILLKIGLETSLGQKVAYSNN